MAFCQSKSCAGSGLLTPPFSFPTRNFFERKVAYEFEVGVFTEVVSGMLPLRWKDDKIGRVKILLVFIYVVNDFVSC